MEAFSSRLAQRRINRVSLPRRGAPFRSRWSFCPLRVREERADSAASSATMSRSVGSGSSRVARASNRARSSSPFTMRCIISACCPTSASRSL